MEGRVSKSCIHVCLAFTKNLTILSCQLCIKCRYDIHKMEGFLANLSEWMYTCKSTSKDDLDPLTTSTAPMAIIPTKNINKIHGKLKVQLPCIIVLYESNEIISQLRFFKEEHMDTAKWNTFFLSTIKHPGHSGFFFILMICVQAAF